jgi:hypothetical protein
MERGAVEVGPRGEERKVWSKEESEGWGMWEVSERATRSL